MIGLFTYLPSTALIPLWFYVLGLPFIFIKRKKLSLDPPSKNTLAIIFLIIILSIINSFITHFIKVDLHQGQSRSIISSIPYSLFFIISFLYGQFMSKRDLIFFLSLVIIEVVVGVIEFSQGIRTILPWVSNSISTEFGYGGLLYYSRVFGLSENSSVFSYKVLICIIFLKRLNLPKTLNRAALIILGVGLLITFNRSSIVCLILFIFLNIIFESNNDQVSLRKFNINYIFLGLFILIIISIYIVFNFEIILNQFNRGRSNPDDSGRLAIWQSYFKFILENPFLGNGSIKKWIIKDGRLAHAHNTYIITLASNGFIIFIFYIFLLFSNIKKSNFIFILPILLLGMTQYAFFWGVSFIDIFLYYFLLVRNKQSK